MAATVVQGSRTQSMGMSSTTYRTYKLDLDITNATAHALQTGTALYLVETARPGAPAGRGGVLTVAGGYFKETPPEDFGGIAERRPAEAGPSDFGAALASSQAAGEGDDGLGLYNVQTPLSGGGMLRMSGPMISVSFPSDRGPRETVAGYGSAAAGQRLGIHAELELGVMVQQDALHGLVVVTPTLAFRGPGGVPGTFRYLLTFAPGPAPAKPYDDRTWTLSERRLLPATAEAVLPLLQDAQTPLWQRVFAARWAGELGEAAAPMLTPLVSARASNEALRASAILGLGATRQAAALPALVELAQGKAEPDTVRLAAVKALGLLGQTGATPALLAVAAGKDDEEARAALAALGRLRDRSAADAVLRILEGGRTERHNAAGRALGALAADEHLPRLGAVAKNPKSKAASDAVLAIAGINSPAAVALLADLTKTAATEARKQAASGLGESDLAEAVAALAATLESADKDLRQAAAEALAARTSPERTTALRAALRHADEKVRAIAARGLGDARAVEARTDLLALLADATAPAGVREAAAGALGSFEGDEARKALLGAVSDAQMEVRRGAAQALARGKVKAAAPMLLTAALEEKEEGALRAQVDAILALDAKEVSRFPEVLARFRDATSADTRRELGRILRHLSGQDHTPKWSASAAEIAEAAAKWQAFWDARPR